MRFRLSRSVLILCTTVALATLAGFTPVFAKDVTVTVYAGADGRIRKIEMTDASGTKSLGADLKPYQEALKTAVAAAMKTPSKKVGKLKLEIEKSLLHEYVVQLIDIGVRAGYTDISPEPLDDKKAAAG